MQSLYPFPKVLSTTAESHLPHNMSSTNDIIAQGEFATSTITLVNNPSEPSPHTPPPKTVTTPTNRPAH